MPTLRFHFTAGRYHATPTGHHVNEGLVEWPPSPWRIVRALVAAGFTTQGWIEIPTAGRSLFDKLAGCLPSYRLPSASAAHSRHYMPLGTLEKGREKTTLVFDTWADVGDEPMDVHWDSDLTVEESAILARLADCLGYLGRSESWTEAELLKDDPLSNAKFNAYPHQDDWNPGRGWEQISLMAAIPPEDYASWRQRATASALAPFPLPAPKKKPSARLVKDRENALKPYPLDLLDCLMKDTAWWKGHRWSQAPGSRRVVYWRRADSIEVGVPEQSPPSRARSVTTMLLALVTPSGNKSALPSVSRTLPQAELFHRSIVGRVANGARVDCPELTGVGTDGTPLKHGHRHAHILPVDLDGDGRLDHLIVHAAMGLGDAAQAAIRSTPRTWSKGGVSLQVALAGLGALDDLRSIPSPLDLRIERILAPRAGSVTWESQTPFVPPRFLKIRGANTLEGQINAELASRGLPPATEIEILRWDGEHLDSIGLRFRHFVRIRQHGVSPPIDVGFAVRLRFANPIRGPLSLGYASHFGLGLFQSS